MKARKSFLNVILTVMGRKRKEVDLTTYAGRFAYMLRTLREAKGLSTLELADLVGVSIGSIKGWERADNTPPVEILPKLAEALGTKPRMLIPEE